MRQGEEALEELLGGVEVDGEAAGVEADAGGQGVEAGVLDAGGGGNGHAGGAGGQAEAVELGREPLGAAELVTNSSPDSSIARERSRAVRSIRKVWPAW